MSYSMSVRELSQLRHLKHEIATARRRLVALQGARRSLAAECAETEASDIGREIDFLQRLISDEMSRAIAELLRLQSYINGLEDSELRRIFYYRYIKCMSWHAVAFAMGYAGEQVPRRIHNAHLAKSRVSAPNEAGKGAPRLDWAAFAALCGDGEQKAADIAAPPLPDPAETLRRAAAAGR